MYVKVREGAKFEIKGSREKGSKFLIDDQLVASDDAPDEYGHGALIDMFESWCRSVDGEFHDNFNPDDEDEEGDE